MKEGQENINMDPTTTYSTTQNENQIPESQKQQPELREEKPNNNNNNNHPSENHHQTQYPYTGVENGGGDHLIQQNNADDDTYNKSDDVNFYIHVGGDEDDDDDDVDPYDDDDEDEDGGIMMRDKAGAVATAIVESGMPSPPDGGWGWVIVAASFMCFVVIDGVTSSFGVLLPEIVKTFQQDNPSIGRSHVAWAGSLLAGFSLCIGPVVSALTNKFGCRSVTIAGSIVSTLAFIGASYSPNLAALLLTYGLLGGIGAGLLYLPAIVCVGYYFESKRALATGIALSGSGIGAMLFAPVITAFSEIADWRMVCLGCGGMTAILSISGFLMRPLEIKIATYDEDENLKKTPLLQRMAIDKKSKMEKASIGGSDFFMVQLPDGSMEKRLKKSLNIDPGVHSVLYLDQLAMTLEGGSPMPLLTSNVDILPTIKEAKPIGGDNNQAPPPAATAQVASSNGSIDETVGSKPSRPLGSRTPQKQMSCIEQGSLIPPNSLPGRVEGSGSFRSSRARTTSITAETAVPPHSAQHRRERRHSEGGQSPTKTTATTPGPPNSATNVVGFTRNKSELSRKSSATPKPSSAKHFPRNESSFSSGKGSEALFCYESLMSSKEGFGLPGDGTPREKKYSIRAVPSTTSFGKRKNSFESSQFKSSVANIKDSRRELFDDDYKFLLSTSRDSVANNQLLRKFSIDRKKSTTGGGGDPSLTDNESKFIIRPLSRKDIFYSGSIKNLPEYQSQDLNGYHQSIINIAKKVTDEEMYPPLIDYKKPSWICPCLKDKTSVFLLALGQMMDFSLLKNPVFITIALSAVFGMLGFSVPIVYAVDFAVQQGIGIGPDKAAYLISIIGITSTIGRVCFGMLADLPWVNSLFTYNSCILAMGLSTFLLPFCFNYYAIAFLYFIFGTALSGFIALSSIILVELLGLENLTNAFGLLIFFRGISNVLGTPLSGAIFDATQSFAIPFHLAGVFLIIAAIISYMIPFISRFAPPKRILEPRKSLVLEPLEDIIEETAESGSEHNTIDNPTLVGDNWTKLKLKEEGMPDEETSAEKDTVVSQQV